MQRPLNEHISRLEERIVVLKRQLRAGDLSSLPKGRRELELANSEEALRLFRKAFELEQKISK